MSSNEKYTGQALTVNQTAAIFRVTPKTIRLWIEAGLLDAILLPQKPGSTKKYWRIKGESIDAILNASTIT